MRLDVEAFGGQHPAMDADSLVKSARAALGKHDPSPRAIDVRANNLHADATIFFNAPDSRTENTFQRPVLVENGAIVVAGLVLNELHNLQLSRATRRGSRVDYFVGPTSGSEHAILEVSGTDSGALPALLQRKRTQLHASHFRKPPFCKPGYVSVTRFGNRAGTYLDHLPPASEPT
jgi:hypothetical protein